MAAQQATKNRERWRPVLGYEGWYEVSTKGRVRRSKSGKGTHIGRILRPGLSRLGYLRVALCKHGVPKSALVHRLVLEGFCEPCPQGHEANHKDGNKTNNVPNNLEWCTSSKNSLHSCRVLGKHQGEKNPMARLTTADVIEIRRRAALSEPQHLIAKDFGIHWAVVSHIHLRKSWRHIP